MKRLLPLALTFALALSGCTPAASAPTETPKAAPSAAPSSPPAASPSSPPQVYTDWSQLEDRDDTPRPDLYDRWYGEFTDHLIPAPDYGPLIPFSGPSLADKWSDGAYCLEGLMTLDGKVVVDPVYASITRLGWGGYFDFGIFDGYHPALLLSRYVGEGSKGDPNSLFGAYGDVRSRLCAADGSWVTGEYRFGYTPLCYGYVPEEGGLFALRDENVLVMLDMNTGKERFSVTLDGLTDRELSDALSYAAYGDGRVTTHTSWHEQGHLRGSNFSCWDLNGNEIPLPDDVDDIDGFSEGLCPARRTGGEGYAWGYLGLDGQWAIPPQFTDAQPFENGVALLGTHAHTLIDKEGNVLAETPVYDRCQKTGDYWYFCGYSGDAGLVLDKEGNEVASPLLHGGYVDALNYGWAVMTNADGSHALGRGENGWPIPEGWGNVWAGNVTEDALYLNGWTEGVTDDEAHWAVWRPENGRAPTVFSGNFDSLRTDPVTGERYCVIYDDYSSGRCHITDLGGKTLFDGLSGWPRLYAGRCLTKTTGSNGKTVELRDKDGSVLFRRTWADPFG